MGHDEVPAPPTAAYWDSVGETWLESHPDALWRAYCDNRHCALIDRWLPAAPLARVLKTDAFDEAVSGGVFPLLQQRARRVSAIDISPVILRAAKTRYPQFEGVVSDVRRLSYAEGTFDTVISISTLDHFESLDAIPDALREIHRVLRPGGGLLVTLDNDTHPTVAIRNRLPFDWLHRLGLVPYRVGKTCSGPTLRKMLIAAGFDVRHLTYVEHCPRLPAVRIGRLLSSAASDRTRAAFFGGLAMFESFERLPLRALTGHYIACWAVKR